MNQEPELTWLESLAVRAWEWSEYDGFCNLKITRAKTTPRALRGGLKIAGILKEAGLTEEQAKKWHWIPEIDKHL